MLRLDTTYLGYMGADHLYETTSLSDAENWLALGGGALLLFIGASRRSAVGALLAASAPLLYRGITGHWPALGNGDTQPDNTKTALGRTRGVDVRESNRLEVSLPEVYGFWRRENLPRFMMHLDRVTRAFGRQIALGCGRAGRAGR